MGRIVVIGFSGTLCVGITLILGALLLRARRQLREALVARAVLDTAATIAQKSHQEAANLREMLDAVPMPVWRRGPDFTLADCNRAYADALDTTVELALVEGR
jgi:PAS domain-containing protein